MSTVSYVYYIFLHKYIVQFVGLVAPSMFQIISVLFILVIQKVGTQCGAQINECVGMLRKHCVLNKTGSRQGAAVLFFYINICINIVLSILMRIVINYDRY